MLEPTVERDRFKMLSKPKCKKTKGKFNNKKKVRHYSKKQKKIYCTKMQLNTNCLFSSSK